MHSTKISGKFGLKLNESVWSNRKSFEKAGPPFEVDHFFRSDRSEFWLNGSRPLIGTTIENREKPTHWIPFQSFTFKSKVLGILTLINLVRAAHCIDLY